MQVLGLALLAAAGPVSLHAQAAPPAPAASPAPAEAPDPDEIVVEARRQPGTVIGDIPPEIQLNPAQIRSYGVNSVADLLNELAPQTRSGRGRGGGAPAVLLNGQRISGFAEIANLPTEAILRVDVLPEEVALKYGFRADQRVVNFVLRPRFRAVTGELRDGLATAGGGNAAEGEANWLRIGKTGRTSLTASYKRSDALLERDRDVVSSPGSRPFDTRGNITALLPGAEIDPALSALAGQRVTIAGVPLVPRLGDFAALANRPNATDVSGARTLRPETQALTLGGVVNRTVFGTVAATLNAQAGYTTSAAQLGLPGVVLTLPAGNPFSPFASDVALYRYPDGIAPLRQSIEGMTGRLAFTLNGGIARWRWSLTGSFDHTETRTQTDAGLTADPLNARLAAGSLDPFGPLPLDLLAVRAADRASAIANVGVVDLLLNGTVLALPAGDLGTSVRVGGQASRFAAQSTRAGLTQSGTVSRQVGNGQLNFDVPIASRRNEVLAALGDLSLNANVAVDHFSDFGTLTTIGYGLNWSPTPPLTLLVSVTDEHGAPTPQQLGNPLLRNPDVRVFDFVRGETANVTRLDGGNPALTADNRHVVKLGLSFRLSGAVDLTANADYVRNTIRGAIVGFPTPTPEIEAAFPDRFVRGTDGRLLQLDSRPVNFDRTDREELRWGFNFATALKASSPAYTEALRGAFAASRPPGARPPGDGAGPGRGGGGGFGGGGRGGFGGGGNRLQVAVYHTWHLRDEVRIRPGLPVLDLLNGAATGSRGGQPRHEIELQGGATHNGLGFRISGNWASGTTVRGLAGSDLNFAPLTTANLRLFANLGQQPALLRAQPWLRGSRVALSVDNLFDARLRVTDATGATPLGYQPGLLDPLGRVVRISVRKLFF